MGCCSEKSNVELKLAKKFKMSYYQCHVSGPNAKHGKCGALDEESVFPSSNLCKLFFSHSDQEIKKILY